jgi:NitT/TauT family transport system substrate-binding protein
MFFADLKARSAAVLQRGRADAVRSTRKTTMISLRVIAPLQAAFLLLAAMSGPAASQSLIRFSLDSRIDGPTAPYLFALDRGYYRAEGLDIAVDPAAGPLEPITRVVSGSYDMAVADINAVIRFRDQTPSAPLRAVFVVYNRPPFSIIARRSRGIAAPKDLEDKKLGAPATEAAAAHWRLFARVNGIDPAKVTVENIGLAVREPMLAAGQVDAVTGLSFLYLDLKDRGVPINDLLLMLMADHGVELYGNAIIVNEKFAAERPEAVRGFLRAFLKGLKETVREPGRAIDSVARRNEGQKRDIELERLQMAIRDNILTPEVRAHGYGGVDLERLERAIEQLALVHELKGKPKPADVFDPSFLPPPEERRAN